MSVQAPMQAPVLPPSLPNAVPPPQLSEKEQAEHDRVLTHFTKPDYVLPGVEAAEAPLTEAERMWLSYECIQRYMRATGRDVPECIKRLEGSLKWRRDYGLYTFLTADYVEPEALSGKEFAFGYDTCGRPALHLSPTKYATEGPLRMPFVVWSAERAIELMGPGVETIAFLANYMGETSNPSISNARQLLHILQTHYPERLGLGIMINLPWLFYAFFRLITPFMDAYTRSKLVFDSVTDGAGLWRTAEARDRGQKDAKLFELDQLLSGWSGTASFTYDHQVYWPALLAMCEARRNDMLRVWRELGGTIGIKEWDVKVGVRDGLAAPPNAADATGQAL